MTEEKQHAKLSASSSHRWLNCPPSVNLCEQFDDESSSYAEEGTQAHSLCEYKLKTALRIKCKDPTPSLTYYNEEMESCANYYATYILEILECERSAGHDPQIFIEQRVDFSRYVENGFGTCDAIIVSDGTLYVIDMKFGKGVRVESKGNPQLRIYVIGALEHFGMLYDISVVSMIIFQPRLEHISDETVFIESITQWAEEVLIPTAQLAYNGEGEFKAGEHCRFCKAKAQCRERANANMEMAQYDFIEPALLDIDEIATILTQADELISWAGHVKEFALTEALKGVQFTGFKIVEGRSNRKITDDNAAAKKLKSAGFKDVFKPKELLGIGALEKLCGADKLSETLGSLIIKPQAKPTLVPESDKRKAINTAADDFADTIN